MSAQQWKSLSVKVVAHSPSLFKDFLRSQTTASRRQFNQFSCKLQRVGLDNACSLFQLHDCMIRQTDRKIDRCSLCKALSGCFSSIDPYVIKPYFVPILHQSHSNTWNLLLCWSWQSKVVCVQKCVLLMQDYHNANYPTLINIAIVPIPQPKLQTTNKLQLLP